MLYTPEHLEMRAAVRRFVDREINPYVDEWEDAEGFPAHELFKKIGQQGYFGVNKPEAFGGMGLDFSYALAVAEGFGHCHAGGVGMSIGAQANMATPALAQHGSDALRHEFLAPAIAGDVVASIAVSEPGAGSDVASLHTTARRDGDDYVINGTKMWITNSPIADWACVLANTSDGPVHKNKSLIVVPLRERGQLRAGISVQKIKKMGMWSSETGQVFFDDVRVPVRFRIGEEGMGFIYQMQQFQEERLDGAARRIAAIELIDDTVDYLRQRQAFGQPLLNNQVIQYKLAELKAEWAATRALVYQATEAYLAGEDVVELASMAKLKASRLGRDIADWCVQFQGGMGYTWHNRAGRAFRDYRVASIAGGADEVMLMVIARKMGLMTQQAR